MASGLAWRHRRLSALARKALLAALICAFHFRVAVSQSGRLNAPTPAPSPLSETDRAAQRAFSFSHGLNANYSSVSRLFKGTITYRTPAPLPTRCLNTIISIGNLSSNGSRRDTESSWSLQELADLDLVEAAGGVVTEAALQQIALSVEAGFGAPYGLNSSDNVTNSWLHDAMEERMSASVEILQSYLAGLAGRNANTSLLRISYPVETVFEAWRKFPGLTSEYARVHEWALVPNITDAPFEDTPQIIALMVQLKSYWPLRLQQLEELGWVLLGLAAGQIRPGCSPSRRLLHEEVPELPAELELLEQRLWAPHPGRQLLQGNCVQASRIDLESELTFTCGGLAFAGTLAAAGGASPAVLAVGLASGFCGIVTPILKNRPDIFNQQYVPVIRAGCQVTKDIFGIAGKGLSPQYRWLNLACSVVTTGLLSLDALTPHCATSCAGSICGAAAAGCVAGWGALGALDGGGGDDGPPTTI